MTYQQLQDLIVSRFWSESLKREIRTRNYVFPPKTLMCIAYKNANSYTERLRLMELFIEHVPEVAEHAALVIRWLEDCLAKFKAAEPGDIFELGIDIGDDDPEHYICSDFDTCLEMIDQFYEYYDWLEENEKARYSITKRKLLRSGDELDPLYNTDCELGPGKELLRVPTGMTCEYGECDGYCEECEHPCVDNRMDLIPAFIPDLSAVRYRDFTGEIGYGCILTGGTDDWEAYIVPTDSSMFDEGLEKCRDFLDHCHVKLPDVEQIDPSELPEAHRRNYDAFAAFWKKQYPEQYGEESK